MKTTLSALTLFASALAADNATTPTCAPVAQQCCRNTFKPNELTYTTYGEFLYMQPTSNNMYYGASAIGINYSNSQLAAIASPQWTILEVQPDYHPGFEVGVRFGFHTANIELGANWQWLHGDDSDSFDTLNLAGYMVGPFSDIGPNSTSYKNARGSASSQFDAVNLTFARELCFFNNFRTRFYSAAAFVCIKQTLQSSFSNVAGTIARQLHNSSTFLGAGPQMGLDYEYRMCNNFFFSGSSVASLIMGQMRNTATYQSYTPALNGTSVSNPNNQATTIPNRAQLVPALEQKLGFSYLATWNQVRATVELGYRCQAYFNAIQNFNMVSQVLSSADTISPTIGMFAVAFDQTNSNFMLTGPYATIGVEY